jgi:hypothetical protein
VRKALMTPFLALAAVLVAFLAVASPASAAAGAANSSSATAAVARPAATSSSVTTFIKAFVDSKVKANDAAFGQDVFPTSDGGYIVTGAVGVPGNGWVSKLSPTGTVQWQETYGSGYSYGGNSVEQTADGGYIVGGKIEIESPESIQSQALLLKLSSTGALQFQDVFNAGVTFNSAGYSVKQTPDGGYILAGSEVFLLPDGNPGTASWLAKTTSTGTLSWQHIFYGPSASSGFQSVRLTSDGGYVAAGTTGDFADADNFWLVKTDSNGNVASGSCKDQYAGTTTEQAGGLTATTTSFPIVTPPSNPPAATTDNPGTTSLVTESVC